MLCRLVINDFGLRAVLSYILCIMFSFVFVYDTFSTLMPVYTGSKLNNILMAYSLSNNSIKNYYSNQTSTVNIIIDCWVVYIFATRCSD